MLAATALVAACGSPRTIDVACNQAAIVGGSEVESFLGLTPRELSAIVGVSIDFEDGSRKECSGVLMNTASVLTSAHCARGGPVASVRVFALGSDGSAVVNAGAASVASVAPEQDAMLLQLADDMEHLSLGLRIATRGPALGESVEIAGFGSALDGSSALRFAVESVQTVASERFTVSGGGASGACAGDSGGPALRRGDDGAVEIVGVLSSGSAGCLADDAFVDASSLSDWLENVQDTRTRAERACPTYGARGRCYGDKAVFCRAGEVHAEQCGPGRCGWSASDGGYRCLADRAVDACGGASDLGECDGTDNVWCDNGVRHIEPCGLCAARCVRLASTGRTGCVE